jgi:hypothetical protein
MRIEVEIGEEVLEQIREATRTTLGGKIIDHVEDYVESCVADPNRHFKSDVWKETLRTWLVSTYGEKALTVINLK